MGFGQGLSGLNAAAQNLDVIGNNIANAGTVGFKTGSATFADVYANSRVGLGVQVSGINQRFSVGNVANTGNMFDMAIDGEKGFFRLSDTSGAVSYSRNGQFFADKNNYIVNAQGQRLTGYASGGVGSEPTPMLVPKGNVPPKATTNATTVANLDANAPVINKTFDPGDPATYTNRQPINVHDSLGNSHQLYQYFVKTEGTTGESQWQGHYRIDGQKLDEPKEPVTLKFDTAGRLTKDPTNNPTNNPTSQKLVLKAPGGTASPAEPLSIDLNYDGTTSFGGDFAISFTQNGYSTGEYTGISISPDGTMQANYTNGTTQVVGIVALVNFNNVQGLQPAGGNGWVETAQSGQPVLGQPGANGMAKIKDKAVEESNVDMSAELVNMIVAQRSYQANAQTIKTQHTSGF